MKSVLFVCLGNICRSPSAEAVFKKMAEDRCLPVCVDSAGITHHHQGESADSRMMRCASKRGYALTSVSRPVVVSDFYEFDYIIGMDASNIVALEDMVPTGSSKASVSLMTDYCSRSNALSVPDPYYGGVDGFELVLDLLEDACDGLLQVLQSHR